MDTVYVSYSNTDRNFATFLVERLQLMSVDVWIDFLKLQVGENWRTARDRGLSSTQVFVVCLSPRSVASAWVREEIMLAKEQNKYILPVMIERCWDIMEQYNETKWLLDIHILTLHEYSTEQGMNRLIKEVQQALIKVSSSQNLPSKLMNEVVSDTGTPLNNTPPVEGGLRPIRVFISSPEDLFSERKVIKEVIRELNYSPRYLNHFKLIPYAYEDSAPARAGQAAQVVVDNYVIHPKDTDIFVCMMWLRMGTPTTDIINPETQKPYHSGTEYEFLSAYHASQHHNKPLILLYQCTRVSRDMTRLDTEQLARVQGFFARFEPGRDLKGLFRKFRTKPELKEIIRRDLEALLEKHF